MPAGERPMLERIYVTMRKLRRAHQTIVVHPSRLDGMKQAVEERGLSGMLSVRASELIEEDRAYVFKTNELSQGADN